MIEVTQITKRFGRFEALRGVSFRAEQGQIVGLLGPNGAGKSTTMRILTGIIPPTTGSAKIGDHDSVRDSLEVRRMLGYLPETPPIYPEMRVRSFLRFKGRLHGLKGPRLREAADASIERCWLQEVADRRVGVLSKGYRQRVGLAAALLHDPPVVILDEPTSGLDPAQIAEARRLIRELGKEKVVLFSSHVLAEVEATCDSAVIIAGGRVLASGPLEEIRASNKSSPRCIIEVKSSGDAQSLLATIPGVRKIEPAPAVGNNGWRRFFVDAESDERGLRERLAATVVQSGGALRELTSDLPTLEQTYMQMLESQRDPEGSPS